MAVFCSDQTPVKKQFDRSETCEWRKSSTQDGESESQEADGNLISTQKCQNLHKQVVSQLVFPPVTKKHISTCNNDEYFLIATVMPPITRAFILI